MDRFNEVSSSLLLMLKEVANTKGITLSQISEKTGFAVPNVSRMLNAKSDPSLSNFLRLADAVGLTKFFFEAPDNYSDLGAAFEKAMDELGRRVPKNNN